MVLGAFVLQPALFFVNNCSTDKMSENQHDARNLTPILFEGDEQRYGISQEYELPAKFVSPERSEQQKADIERHFKARYDEALNWGKVICNVKVLKCEDRNKLKDHLDRVLEGLWNRLDSNPPGFPSTAEFCHLTEVISKLATLLGVKKFGFGDLLSAMNRIQNRWGKLRLIEFADYLRERLLRIPISPLSAVKQARQNCPHDNRRRQQVLREIELVLTDEGTPRPSDFPWEKLFIAIEEQVFSKFLHEPKDLISLVSGSATIEPKRKICYLLFMDLRRQQLEWQSKYARNIAPSLNWLQLLNRQGDFDSLNKVYYATGCVLEPKEMDKELGAQANRDRRNKHYREHQARSRKNQQSAKKKK